MEDDHSRPTVEHYERLLAPIYAWMIGGLEASIARNGALFDRLGLHSRSGGEVGPRRALDVGSGPGPQSLALAERGYRVTAIDPSATLVAELRAQTERRGLDIVAVCDGAPLGDRHPGPFDAVTCMVDTLVSLPDRETARGLVFDAARRLAPGGRLVISWRDLTRLPEGDARFLSVRSDGERILTCFLEPVDEERVRVHDLLHQWDGQTFTQRVSSYLKLRLAPERVTGWARDAGLSVEPPTAERGLQVLVGRRSPGG